MKPQEITFNIKGMKPDLDISKSNAEFSFRNENVQITQSSTNNSLVLDVGLTYDISPAFIEGNIIGLVPFEDKVVLFTIEHKKNRIYLVREREVKLVFEGDLNFDHTINIEGLYYNEGEGLAKVYWVDGKNPLRVINVDWNKSYLGASNTIFDINHTQYFDEILSITKRFADGSFHSGTVQYFFTYFDRYGKESSIFTASSLYYSTPNEDRAGSPEETCTNVFDISLDNLHYNNVRIYSLHRTSKDTTPSAYIVKDAEVNNNKVKYTDNNRGVTAIDPNILLYLGAEFFIPKTLAVKDNTMFLGNYSLPTITSSSTSISVRPYGKKVIYPNRRDQLYLSQDDITFLKYNENYPIIIQWLNSWGKPIGYSGKTVFEAREKNKVVNDAIHASTYGVTFQVPSDSNIKAARILIHYPEGNERRVLTQGILNPTVFNLRDRLINSPYVQASWFFRPETKLGKGIPFAHGYPVGMWQHGVDNKLTAELELFKHQSFDNYDLSNYEDYRESSHMQMFGIDRSIITINTPEIEDIVSVANTTGINLVGLCRINEGYFGYDTLLTDIDEFETTKGDYALGYPYALGSFPTGLSKGYNPIYSIGSAFNRIGNIEGLNAKINKNLLKTKTFYSYKRSTTSYDVDGNGILDELIKVDTTEEKLYKIKDKFYKGTINTVITNDLSSTLNDQNYGIGKEAFHRALNNSELFDITPFERDDSKYWNTKGVPVTYKSTEHLVALIDNIDGSPILNYAFTNPQGLLRYDGSNGTIDISELENLSNTFEIQNFKFTNNKHGVTFKKDNVEFSPTSIYRISYSKVGKLKEEFLKNHLLTQLELVLTEESYTKKEINNDTIELLGTDTNIYSIKNLGSDGIVLYIPLSSYKPTISKIVSKLIGIYNINAPIEEHPQAYNYPNAYYNLQGIKDNQTIIFLADIINTDLSDYSGDLSWTPASDVVPVNNGEVVTIPIKGGDTYFQTYDCVKTLPYKDTDYNQVIEALSVSLETRVNLYGRYDKNLDIYKYSNVNENNFNKINPVYSQKNNFFIFRNIDSWKLRSNFPNQVTWSKMKTNGEFIDTFTHYSLASVVDLDGTHGSLTKLINFKDNILFIQDNGFGIIPFNSRVQIPVSDGIPIEITNGYKVDGYKYISDTIGSNLKGTIVKSLDYLYFYSSTYNELYQYSQGLVPLGVVHGMSSLLTPFFYDASYCRGVYSIDHRVFFGLGNSQLVFNEALNSFESFYTYPISPFMYTTNAFLYSYSKDKVTTIPTSLTDVKFDNVVPWEIEYKINPSLDPKDRIFTNAEFVLGENTPDKEDIPFNKLTIENEYQSGVINGMKGSYKQKATAKKFRFYNTQLPRDSKNKLDRIRSPWVKVKLSGLCDKKTNNLIRSFKIKYFE